MPYRIVLSDNVIFVLKDIQDRRVQHEIAGCIDGLALGPEEQGRTVLGELYGYGCRSILTPGGSYRVIYRVVPPARVDVLGIHKVGGVRSVTRMFERFRKLLFRLIR